MNIFPTIELASRAVGALSNLFSDNKNEKDFADMLEQYQGNSQNAQQDSLPFGKPASQEQNSVMDLYTQALDQSYASLRNNTPAEEAFIAAQQAQKQAENPVYKALEEAPVAPHSENGVLYEVSETGFTQQELLELQDTLRKENVAPEVLQAVGQLAASPHGATLGQVLAVMNSAGQPIFSLNDSEKAALQNFLDKIDKNGNLGAEIIRLLQNGQHKDAWNQLKAALDGLDAYNNFVLEADEAAILCKGFGISNKNTLGILRQFGNSEGLLLNADLFKALMVPVQQEILTNEAAKTRLNNVLGKHLQPLVAKAKQRSELELKAAQGTDRKARQSEVFIRDKVMDAINSEIAGSTKDGAAHFLAEKNTSLKSMLAEQTGKDAAPKKMQTGDETSDKANLDEWQKQLLNSRIEKNESKPDNGKQNSRDMSWESLLARLEARQTHQNSPAGASFTLPAQTQQAAGPQQSAAPRLPQALQQIEQGMLQKLNNGGQRLELQLTPTELGNVTLILTTAKSGEINALIRADKSETADLVARHLDVMRVNLEQQGVKIDKLEVQNQMLGNQDNWQGMEQHNAMREEQERRDNINRLRRLGQRGSAGEDAAQDMQNDEYDDGYTANISTQGLHLVA